MKIKSLLQLTTAATLLPFAASAATIVWDGLGDGSTFTDGLNWGGTAPADDTTTDIAQLTGGSVTLDADRSVNGLDVDSTSTLTGSGTRLILGGGGLTGTSDITLGGTVILRTGTAAAYTGNITVDGATIEITDSSTGVLGTGTINLDNGGTLVGYGSHVNMGDTTSIVLGSGGGTIANAHTRAFYGLGNAVISGSGKLTLDGVGSTAYSGNSRIQLQGGNNTYTGGTLITNKANVQVNSDANFGATSGKVTIDDGRIVTDISVDFGSREFEIGSGGGRISLENNAGSVIGGILSGSGTLTVDGQNRGDNSGTPSGTLTINSTNSTTFTGDVIVGENTVLKVSRRALDNDSGGFSDIILVDGGELSATNDHIELNGRNIVLNGTGGTLRHVNDKNIYGMGIISGDGQLTLAGANTDAGRHQISGVNTYTGGTRIIDGAQAWLYADYTFGLAGTSVTMDGGDIVLQNNVNLGARNFILESGGGELKTGNRLLTINGEISGVGALTANRGSTGSLYITGNNTYSGGTNLDSLYVRATNSDAFGTGDVTLTNNAEIQIWNSNPNYANNFIIGSGGGQLKAGWGKSMTISGVVSGSDTLTIRDDSGFVALTNEANTFSGNLSLGDGSSGSATGVLKVASLGGGNYSGAISGDGTLEFIGSGTQIISNANTYSGGTTLTSGVVQLGNVAALGTGDIALSGGTLDVNGHVVGNTLADGVNGGLRNTGAAVDYSSKVINMNGGTLTVDGTGDITLGDIGRIDGNLSVIKDGSNTVNLTGSSDNSYVNATVEAGTLVLAKASNSGVHSASSLTVNGGTAQLGGTGNDQIYNGGNLAINGGTFAMGTFNEQVKNLTLAGGDVTGTGTLTVSGGSSIDAQSGTVSAVLAGSAGLTKTTAGTVTLNAVNIFSGATVISEGTLALGASGSIASSSSITVASGAIFDTSAAGGFNVGSGQTIAGAGQVDGDLTIGSGASFLFSETDTLTVTGALTLDNTFGVDNIIGLSSATMVGTYMLIDVTGDFSNIENFGLANAYDLGDGYSAYFKNGSLELVVVPEPGTFALLAGMLALSSVMIRRRRS